MNYLILRSYCEKRNQEPRRTRAAKSSVRVLPVHGFGSVLVLHIFCMVSSSSVRFFQNEGSSSVRIRFYSHLYVTFNSIVRGVNSAGMLSRNSERRTSDTKPNLTLTLNSNSNPKLG